MGKGKFSPNFYFSANIAVFTTVIIGKCRASPTVKGDASSTNKMKTAAACVGAPLNPCSTGSLKLRYARKIKSHSYLRTVTYNSSAL